MSIRNRVFVHSTLCKNLACVAGFFALSSITLGQGVPSAPAFPKPQTDQARIDAAITKAQAGGVSGYEAELLGEARAVQSIPGLEKQFALTSEPLDKAKFAEVLVKLGDKDDQYWNYLVQLATPAIESDMPSFFSYDASGKEEQRVAPVLVAWADAHHIPLEIAEQNSIYLYPGYVLLLGSTDDKRAIPLLRRAMMSPNYSVQVQAATGLVSLGDTGSIPLIIADCKKDPALVAQLLVQPLAYFDQSEAQQAVDTYAPKNIANIYREGRANGRRASGLYPLHLDPAPK